MKWFKKPEKVESPRQYIPEPLTEADRQDLLSIRHHPGYEVIRKVMEQEAETFTTSLLNAKSDEEVLQAQRMAKAAWNFYLRVQKRIEFEVNEEIYKQQEEMGEVNA